MGRQTLRRRFAEAIPELQADERAKCWTHKASRFIHSRSPYGKEGRLGDLQEGVIVRLLLLRLVG